MSDSNSNPKFAYIRNSSGDPVITLAYAFSPSDRKAYYSIAVKNPTDRFHRALGRHIAMGRFKKPHSVEMVFEGEYPRNFDIMVAVVNDIRKNHTTMFKGGLPTRALRACETFLSF